MSVTCGHSDDVDYVELRQLQTEVKLNVSDGIGDCAQAFLLAISNIYGYIVYGTSDGFGFALTKDVREVISNAPKQAYEDFTRGYEVSIPEGVYQLRISADELHVLASTGDGEIRLYDAISLLERKASFVTIHTSSPEQAFVDVQANPEAYPETFAALRETGEVVFGKFDETAVAFDHKVTCICWSRKGKQLAAGTKDGFILQLKPDGSVANRVPPPPELDSTVYVNAVLWFEDKMFAATYIAGDSVYVYIVSQSGTPKVTKYLQFTDPTFYNEVQTPVSHYLSIVRSIGPAITYTLIVGNTFANEFVIYGKTDDKEWAEWVLPDERRITLPLNSTDEDTLPLGLALDFTNTERVPQSPKDSGDFPPSPIVFVLNTDGCILAYHYLYSPLSGERFSCPEMKAAKKFGAEKAELPSPVHEVQSPAIPESKIKNEPSSSSKGDLPVVKLIPPPPAPPTSTSSVQPFSFSFAPSASSKLKEEPVKLGPNVQPSKPGFSFLPKAESSSQRVETPKPEPGQGFPPPPSPLQPFTLNFGKVKTPEKDVAPTSAGNSGSASPLATSSASFESKNFAKLPATSSLGLSAIPAFTLPAQTSAPVSTAASPIPSFASVPFAGPSVVSKPFTPATPPGQVSTFPGSSSSSAFLKTPPPPFIAPTKSFLEFNTSLGPTQPKPITSVASPHPTVKTDAEEIADFAAADDYVKFCVSTWIDLGTDLKKLDILFHNVVEIAFQASPESVILKKSVANSIEAQLGDLKRMANESDSLISTTKSVVEGCIDALKQIHAKRPVVDDLFISVKNPASFTDKKLGLGPEIEGMRLQLIRKIKKLDERVTDVTSLFDSCRANIADAQANRFARRGEWENICKNVRHLTKQALLLSENLDAIAKDVEGLKLTSSPSPVHQTTEVSRSVFQVPKIDNDDGSLRPKGSVELADATLKSMVLRTGFARMFKSVQIPTNKIYVGDLNTIATPGNIPSSSKTGKLEHAVKAPKEGTSSGFLLPTSTISVVTEKKLLVGVAPKISAVPAPPASVIKVPPPQVASSKTLPAQALGPVTVSVSSDRDAGQASSATSSVIASKSTVAPFSGGLFQLNPSAAQNPTASSVSLPDSKAGGSPLSLSTPLVKSTSKSTEKSSVSDAAEAGKAKAAPVSSASVKPQSSFVAPTLFVPVSSSSLPAASAGVFSLGGLSISSTEPISKAVNPVFQAPAISTSSPQPTESLPSGPATPPSFEIASDRSPTSGLKFGSSSLVSKTAPSSKPTSSAFSFAAVNQAVPSAPFSLNPPSTLPSFATTPKAPVPAFGAPAKPTEASSAPKESSAFSSMSSAFGSALNVGSTSPAPPKEISAIGQGFGLESASPSNASPSSAVSAFSKKDASPQVSAFGKSSTSGASAFGQTSAFGQSSAFNAFKPGGASAFGQTSAFGQPSTLGSASAFGDSIPSTGASAFGQTSTPISGASAFGQNSAGTSAFGQTSTPSAGTSAFGQTSTPGVSAFGQTLTPSANSAFGAVTPPSVGSGFGQVSMPSAAPAFGASTPPSAFGQPSASNTFRSVTPSPGGSAFGQSSAFGGGASSAFANTSTTGVMGSTFGATSNLLGAAPAFGQTSGLGGPVFGGIGSSGTAFGQTSSLGGPANAYGTGFGASPLGGPKFPDPASLQNAPVFSANPGLSFAAFGGSSNATGSNTSAFGGNGDSSKKPPLGSAFTQYR